MAVASLGTELVDDDPYGPDGGVNAYTFVPLWSPFNSHHAADKFYRIHWLSWGCKAAKLT